jgi:hypothetical protein
MTVGYCGTESLVVIHANGIVWRANIDGLSFVQFSSGMDSAIIEFFDSKTYQTGKKQYQRTVMQTLRI